MQTAETAASQDATDEWRFVVEDASLPAGRWNLHVLVPRSAVCSCFSQLNVNCGGRVGRVGGVAP